MVKTWLVTDTFHNCCSHFQLGTSCMLSPFSHVWLFTILCTVACQAPLSMGIPQVRILEWVAISSSRGSSQSKGCTHISYVSSIGRYVLYHQCHLESPGTNWKKSNTYPKSIIQDAPLLINSLQLPSRADLKLHPTIEPLLCLPLHLCEAKEIVIDSLGRANSELTGFAYSQLGGIYFHR